VAEIVAAATGFRGTTAWDTSKPDGTPRKVLDVTTLQDLGWMPEVELSAGVAATVEWYRSNLAGLENL
ncbi:GDP-L-fucose synthase, partial [Streptomyces sp. SID10244]|nr:GDP-L-fucose synthase [Streptomyces sp. SID10244]